jgi:hypothetical protein
MIIYHSNANTYGRSLNIQLEYFDYAAVNRLNSIKEDESNIVKLNEYHYKGNWIGAEDCSNFLMQ